LSERGFVVLPQILFEIAAGDRKPDLDQVAFWHYCVMVACFAVVVVTGMLKPDQPAKVALGTFRAAA